MALGMLIQYATSYNSFINFFFMYVLFDFDGVGLMSRLCHPKIPAVTFMGELFPSRSGLS